MTEASAKQEKEHKEKYRQYKLRDCFPADLQYCFNKIILSISLIEEDCGTVPKLPDHGQSTALCNAKDLLEAIDRFEGEIQKRELQDNDSDMVIVRLEIKGSKYPIEKLKEYFRPYSKSHLNAQDAFAYADSAKVHMLGLIDRAKWLDYEYARKH